MQFLCVILCAALTWWPAEGAAEVVDQTVRADYQFDSDTMPDHTPLLITGWHSDTSSKHLDLDLHITLKDPHITQILAAHNNLSGLQISLWVVSANFQEVQGRTMRPFI